MNQQNAGVAGAQRSRCLNEVIFTNLQDLAANESAITDPANDTQCEDQFIQARAEKSHHGDCQQQTREREKDVKDVTGNNTIDPATVITSDGAQKGANNGRHGDDNDPDLQRDPRPKNDTRKNIASR